MVGILTRTVISSPVVKYILQIHIRSRLLNDVVFVGGDSIQVKHVGEYGHLEHVATKCDFDTRIRAAAVLSLETTEGEEDIVTQLKNRNADHSPTQCLILALESCDLLFLSLRPDNDGIYRFAHQSYPIPKFENTIFQPGQHLSVDPFGRAIAVAAIERELVLYTTKPPAQTCDKLQCGSDGWNPISMSRSIQVDGVIQHMDFLRHRLDEQDHIILLLILSDHRGTWAQWIDWSADTDIHQIQIHPRHPLDIHRDSPSMLIPLQNASFIIVSRTQLKRWPNLLSEPAGGVEISVPHAPPLHPGSSPGRPIWVNWSRPGRIKIPGVDHIYLVREDGIVVLLRAGLGIGDLSFSDAGQLDCHVGSAFVSVGGLRDPDVLMTAGDMSSGRSYSIGNWAFPKPFHDADRKETMEMQYIESIPSWTSITDMVLTTMQGKSQRSRDGIFVTCGRQPYGAVVELRNGLEAKRGDSLELGGVVDIWALPLVSVGRTLLVLATPDATRLIDVSSNDVSEIEDDTVALDMMEPTLAAGALADGHLVQVTRKSICLSASPFANFEDSYHHNTSGSTILAASIDLNRPLVITAERSDSVDASFSIHCYSLGSDREDGMNTGGVQHVADEMVHEEPLALCITTYNNTSFAITSTSDGNLHAFEIRQDFSLAALSSHRFESFQDGNNVCDSMVLLNSRHGRKSTVPTFALVCGMRDGWINLVHIDLRNSTIFEQRRGFSFGQSNVRLTLNPNDDSMAYAMSGQDICLLTWNGQPGLALELDSIWVTDEERPAFSQASISAATHMPLAHLLSSPEQGDALLLLSGDELFLTRLVQTRKIVPREIAVSGTPRRLIYAEQQRSFVCSSVMYETRAFPSTMPHSKPEERRQIWPAIHFIPSRGEAPSFTHEMQPGEQVYSMVEWTLTLGGDKTYSHILIAGSYTRSSGTMRGRITFLQPLMDNREVVGVKEGSRESFDAPVYALTMLDDITYAACVGESVVVRRFSIERRKWEPILNVVRLSSLGVHITSTTTGRLLVSTARDSLVSLVAATGEGNARGQADKFLSYSASAPRANALLSHVVLEEADICLATTKHGRVLGFRLDGEETGSSELTLEFEAYLPRSLTRIRRCNVRPPWKGKHGFDSDTREHDLVGSTTDGALIGIRLLDDATLRRLSWLQRLCEWSEEMSPHSFRGAAYEVSEDAYAKSERALPIGFVGDGEIVLRTSCERLTDKHVDGDVLARLFGNGNGVGTLTRLVRQAARRPDRVGEWLRAHLDAELEAIESIVLVVKELLDGWI